MLNVRRHLLAAAAATALVAGAAAPALAAAATLRFNLESGPLDTVLIAYAALTRRQILVDPNLAATHRAAALKGDYSADEALDHILAGTGLEVHEMRPNVFVVRPPKAAGAPQLEPATLVGPTPWDPQEAPATAPEPSRAPAAAEPLLLNELVVTGTLIRGAGPRSSPVLQFDRDAIDRQGQATVADMLANLPQNFGGAGSADSALLGSDARGTNDLAATGVNLRGLGASATLMLVNGRRMAGVGTKGDFSDASALPTAVVDHVDVLLDGASALYGSDAVGGVVNVVLKRRLEGFETRLRVGGAQAGGGEELQASQAYGTAWSSGSLVLAYEYEKHWGLKASERDVTATSDLRPFGGTDRRVFYSHPANILVTRPGASTLTVGWSVPAGQSGVGLKPADFIAGVANLEDQKADGEVLPQDHRHNLYVSVVQDLGMHVRLLADARYNVRDSLIARPTGPAAFTVGRANPFFVSPNGSSVHTLGYSFADEIGPSESRGRAQSLGLSLGAEIELGRDWRADVYGASALEIGRRDTEGLINSRYLNEALGNLPDDPATAYSAARDGYFNPFGDGGANGPAVLDFISSGYTKAKNESRVATFDAKADGPLWSLPGGPLKAALGVQARQEQFKPDALSLVAGTTPVQVGGVTYGRSVKAAFLELSVPLIGPEMHVPLIHTLEASVAGRVERYSDFGRTSNPKLGLLWSPVEDLRLRASYGTSFRAPNMVELHQLQGSSPVLLGTGANQTLALLQTGGNPELGPEHARTWSYGFDYRSKTLPGLSLSATWFDVRFADQIGQPVLTDAQNALTNPALAPFVTRITPGDAAQLAQVKAIMAISTNANIGLFPAEAYRALVDARYVNTGEVRVRGLDAQASYDWTWRADRLGVSASVSYLADYKRRFTPTAVAVQLVDTANQPVDLRARLTGTWTRGAYGLSATLNYVDDYHSETGRRISAWTPVDLQARWTPTEAQGALSGLTLVLNVQNLFDEDPPFYDSPLGIGYDPANADPLGRFVSLQLTKRW